jgi:hypothetical protein|tara:strand:+ start:26203 stop:26706 length:504 start_codon:yes stop_codon:yes gene_type:complete
MLATKNEIMQFFEEEGFLQTLWIAWEGNQEDYWDAIDKILTKVWAEYGVERGFVSYEDLEKIRYAIVEIIEALNDEMNPEPKSTNIRTDMIGDFDISLNEVRTKEMSETDIRRIVKDEMKKALSDYSKKRDTDDHLTKEDVKKMIRNTIVNQYKYLWEKSAFFINNI